MIELELNIKKTVKPQGRWKIFFLTFILVFLLTTIQNLGFKGLSFLSPLPFNNSAFDKILPKLEERENNFKIKKDESLVETSFASASSYNLASSYDAIDFNTGNVILGKNLSKKLPVASLTKIMTAVVALDLANPSEKITISKNATRVEPTTIGVVENQKMTIEELLNALLLTSANDAAQAIKDGINIKYDDDVFIKAMNKKAQFIGLKNTNFANPQGFDSQENYSTVEDLANLTHYALTNYPLISKIVEKDYEFLAANKYHKQFDLYNWNGLLDVYPGTHGVKIGNTDLAGYTTVVVSERNGQKVLAVVLGAPGVLERDLWASQILDDAFQKISRLPKVNISAFDLRQKYSTWKYFN